MHHLPSRYIPCDGRLTASAYFKSTLPAGGATQSAWPSSCAQTFQSTLPAGGATPPRRLRRRRKQNFNPRSPWGERFSRLLFPSPSLRFQSTLPVGGATHPPQLQQVSGHISIHAPRMGSDSTIKAYSNDRIKWSTLREPHFLYSKNACFSPIVSMCAATSRTKKSENQSFIRIISRLGTYVFHLRLVSVP